MDAYISFKQKYLKLNLFKMWAIFSKKKGSKQSKKKKKNGTIKKELLTVEIISGENIKNQKQTNIYVKLHLDNDSVFGISSTFEQWRSPKKKGNASFKIALKDLVESNDGEMSNIKFKIPNFQLGTILVMSLSYNKEDENESQDDGNNPIKKKKADHTYTYNHTNINYKKKKAINDETRVV
ncbi:hypothetical protein RFI_37816 [Reticulomyxa filosa]|uniref:Uncharacterized protein n=1 Tax=Reticulomyxa filosa TaxID=46433 RepID=X6LFY7_RETFI|nr:hypothetical protein RFI_37816 [Reticulomyxa filosa]|eukprot:ETN99654.1 hypothetical protein RFI_37816 [Reticulomyxa filosa]